MVVVMDVVTAAGADTATQLSTHDVVSNRSDCRPN